MTEPLSSPPALPAWVHKRDGRLVPFEADRISRGLFAATEALGRPNAFLARELTDAVLHFLPTELDGPTPATAQLADLVVKVVRELGHPALAQAFADHRRLAAPRPLPSGGGALTFSADTPLSDRLDACTRDYSLRTVFARDLQAAHDDGLLTLTGLTHPDELAGSVLPPAGVGNLVEALEEAQRFTGRFVVLDGPEHVLARAATADVAAYLRELAIGLRATGLHAVVNLNSAAPPSWADDLADGPLFAAQRRSAAPVDLAALAEELAGPLLRAGPHVRVDWHLNERDFLPEAAPRLLRLARRALEGAPLAFVFDRPRKPVALAEGLDRRHAAVLLTVGLTLPRLVEQLGAPADAERFLQKLGSLARLALSAATQKRDFLRRHSPGSSLLARGFLLGRARLVVAPVGLAETVRALTGRGLCDAGAALDFARRLLQRLRAVLEQDGRACQLDTCLDGPADFSLERQADERHQAGLTAWDVSAPVKAQLRTAGALHAIAELGTAAVLLPQEAPAAEQLTGWLHTAWQQGDVVRLRFVRPAETPRQLTLGGN